MCTPTGVMLRISPGSFFSLAALAVLLSAGIAIVLTMWNSAKRKDVQAAEDAFTEYAVAAVQLVRVIMELAYHSTYSSCAAFRDNL